MLYQLSYTPKQQILSFIELPYEHRDTALETAALPTELYPYVLNLQQSYYILKRRVCQCFFEKFLKLNLLYKYLQFLDIVI